MAGQHGCIILNKDKDKEHWMSVSGMAQTEALGQEDNIFLFPARSKRMAGFTSQVRFPWSMVK